MTAKALFLLFHTSSFNIMWGNRHHNFLWVDMIWMKWFKIPDNQRLLIWYFKMHISTHLHLLIPNTFKIINCKSRFIGLANQKLVYWLTDIISAMWGTAVRKWLELQLCGLTKQLEFAKHKTKKTVHNLLNYAYSN